MARASAPSGVKREATCKYCNAAIAWRNMGRKPDGSIRWSPYNIDADGKPSEQHRCMTGSVSASAVQAASGQPATASQSQSQSTATATATASQSGITIPDPDAIDLAAVFDELAELDEQERIERERREARREPEHRAIAVTYAAPIADASGGTRPRLDADYLIDSAQLEAIMRVIRLADATGTPQNIGLHGPAGSGKTTLGVQIGAIRRAPLFVIEAAAKQTADEWYGETIGIDRESGAVQYRESHFVRGIETPGAVVLINDVALLQSRTVQNGLNELLDPSTRSTFVEQLNRTVRVAPGVIIVGTWNVGAEYTGASDLSAQILDRFRAGALFEVPYPSAGALVHLLQARSGVNAPNAARLAALTDWLRNDPDPINVSTRGLIAAGLHIVNGATIGHAIAFTVLGDLDEQEQARAYGIIDVQIGTIDDDERELWATPKRGQYVALGDVFDAATEPEPEPEPAAAIVDAEMTYNGDTDTLESATDGAESGDDDNA